jgi:polysaccharide pyruvyl transferase WcaK-like protein
MKQLSARFMRRARSPWPPHKLTSLFRDPEQAIRHRSSREHGIPRQQAQILLLGLFGCGNYGNDASLDAMVRFLRREMPRANLTCVCVDPAEVRQTFGLDGVRIDWPGFTSPALAVLDRLAYRLPRRVLNWARTVRTVQGFDAMIVPGTGMLCDYRTNPFGAPYWFFRWATAARLCGVPLFLVSVGAGPIERPFSRWMLKWVARAASYRSFRDANSRDFVASLGVDTRDDGVYHDIAFSLPVPALPQRTPDGENQVTVGVGLIAYNGWQGQARSDLDIYATYLAKMVRFVCCLLDRGYRVLLLAGEVSDERVVSDLLARVSEVRDPEIFQAGLKAEPSGSLYSVMQQMSQTDVVVASRYHNIVCALMMKRPTISISYSIKGDALMRDAELDKFCQPIEELDVGGLLAQLTEIVANKEAYSELIADRMRSFRSSLTKQEYVLRDLYL